MCIRWNDGMVKTLTRHGNSLALIIERPILDLLGADAETEFEILTDGNSLVLTPKRSRAKEKAFRSALEKIGVRYEKTFREPAK